MSEKNIEKSVGRALDQYETHLLNLIRSCKFPQLVIHTNHGKINQIDTKEELGEVSAEHIDHLLEEKEFQTITISRCKGKIVRVSRQTPTKFTR